MTLCLTLSSGLNNRNLLSQSSGGKKSEIKMLAGLCSLQRHEGRICSGPLSYLLVVCVNSSVVSVCNPMDYSPSGSSVHGILQTRVLEGVSISYNKIHCQIQFWLNILEKKMTWLKVSTK